MVLNEAIYKQFCPDIEHPTREDFERAAVAINRLPVPYVEPEDITNAVLFLVSDDGRYVTGTKQVIDAGSSLV
jgi:(+)-trans-carveol dehydrogenase